MPTPHFRLWRLLTLCGFLALSCGAIAVLPTEAKLLPPSAALANVTAKSDGA
jgi:hypothetical protein